MKTGYRLYHNQVNSNGREYCTREPLSTYFERPNTQQSGTPEYHSCLVSLFDEAPLTLPPANSGCEPRDHGAHAGNNEILLQWMARKKLRSDHDLHQVNNDSCEYRHRKH